MDEENLIEIMVKASILMIKLKDGYNIGIEEKLILHYKELSAELDLGFIKKTNIIDSELIRYII